MSIVICYDRLKSLESNSVEFVSGHLDFVLEL